MQWISVKDRLPENKTFVLFYGEMYSEEPWFGRMINGQWYDIELPGAKLKEKTVTHWMPLPDPPKE